MPSDPAPDPGPDPVAAQPATGTRLDYRRAALSETDVDQDPITQFNRWLAEAATVLEEPNAMTLATVGTDGRPAARMVLLRAAALKGFDFYTNRQSRKAADLAAAPWAALVFHWPPLQRQVRVEGPVTPVPEEEADGYFALRPRESQLGAWVSPQSQVIPDRAWLETRLEEATRRFQGAPIPRPPHWGGYRLRPQAIEFWQGRPGRVHDRLRYRQAPESAGGWLMERLAP
ncbi:MAG TPA: pyridoxamine 5'-phosphate oxidase [Anaerolineae bacterium]|nr:pyridoxamine 5'-phosphate oxidase [Anaerolineae bacterium]